MSYLEVAVGNIHPLLTNESGIQMGMVTLSIIGVVDGKSAAPFGGDAYSLPIYFVEPLPEAPSALWIANFTGGNFAEITWTVGSVSKEGFILFADNQDFNPRYPCTDNGGPMTMNIVFAVAPTLKPIAKKAKAIDKNVATPIIEKPVLEASEVVTAPSTVKPKAAKVTKKATTK